MLPTHDGDQIFKEIVHFPGPTPRLASFIPFKTVTLRVIVIDQNAA